MSALKLVSVGPTVDHAKYLGGSDVGAVLNLSPYKTQLAVWAEKTGRGKPFDNARLRSGNRFERVILENYAEDTGAELTFPGTILHANGITGSTPDAIENGAQDVQVKFVGIEESKRWGGSELADDGIPAEVLAQVHWESWHMRECLGLKADVARVVAQIATEPRVFYVPIDDEFTSCMVEAGHKWWRDYVVADRMPIVVERDADILRHIYRRTNSKVLDLGTPEIFRLVKDYDEQSKSESRAKKAKASIAVQLMEAIGERLGFEGNTYKVTWRVQKSNIDWEKCARDLGADDAMGERYRPDPRRQLDVRVKQQKGEE